jgi:hypothetical protein
MNEFKPELVKKEDEYCNCPDENGLWCYKHSSSYSPPKESMEEENQRELGVVLNSLCNLTPQEPMEWESELKIIFNTDMLFVDIKHLIEAQIKQAEERERERIVKEIEKLKEDWKATEGYGSEEELGFQKGISAQIKLKNREIEELITLINKNNE